MYISSNSQINSFWTIVAITEFESVVALLISLKTYLYSSPYPKVSNKLVKYHGSGDPWRLSHDRNNSL